MEACEYIGWTPCVNGHLDFGLVNVGLRGSFTHEDLQDKNAISKNFSLNEFPDSHHRGIILQSKVDWRDSEFPEKNIGQFRIFVAAEVQKSQDLNQRSLKGNLLIYPLCAEPEEKSSIQEINAHRAAHDTNKNNAATEFPKAIKLFSSTDSITGLKEDCLIASISFEIRANGITYLKYNTGSLEIEDRSKFIIARQAFYYLKYSVHSHRHHMDEQDSLTTITTKDETCGLRLIGQLKRELTNLGRIQKIDNKISNTSNADGIIAYTFSLIEALKEEKILTPNEAEIETKRFKNISSSLCSMDRRIIRSEDRIELYKAKSKVWIGFGLIFSWSLVNYALIKPENFGIEMNSNYYYAIPVGIIFMAMLSYYYLVRYYLFTGNTENFPSLYNIDKGCTLIRITFFLLLFITALLFEVFVQSEKPSSSESNPIETDQIPLQQ